MMTSLLISVCSLLFCLSALFFSNKVKQIISPRLALAKGVVGNPNKATALLGTTFLSSIWRGSRLNWRHPLLLVLAGETTLVSFSFSGTWSDPWHDNYRLFVPLVFLISRGIFVWYEANRLGSFNPRVSKLILDTTLGALGLATLFFVFGQPWNHWLGPAGSTLRYFVSAVFWLVLTPSLLLQSDDTASQGLVSQMSKVAWSSLGVFFFLPRAEEVFLNVISLAALSTAMLTGLEIIETLISQVRPETSDSIRLRIIIPTILLILVLVFIGI